MNGIPIDYDTAMYSKARRSEGDSEEKLYERYYDQQYQMLSALEPLVVGHFDLIRLLSQQPDRDVRAWTGVWERIIRNLKLVRANNGFLECNSSALRKGLAEPYPCRIIAEVRDMELETTNACHFKVTNHIYMQEWLRMGGRFTFSDDSHGIAQVATNYAKNLDYLESLGVATVYAFKRGPISTEEGSDKKTALREKPVALSAFRTSSLHLG